MVGSRTLVGPLCKAAGITANRKTVSDLVDNSAHAARQIISNELNHQPLIAIEVDGASRGARHFVGINARFIDDGKVVVRNLGNIAKKHFFIQMPLSRIPSQLIQSLLLIALDLTLR